MTTAYALIGIMSLILAAGMYFLVRAILLPDDDPYELEYPEDDPTHKTYPSCMNCKHGHSCAADEPCCSCLSKTQVFANWEPQDEQK